ncbi:MAG: hypothetical protein ACRDRU_01105 [Pseudonocardiaceae bacterium]
MRATTLLNSLLGLPGVAAVDPQSWQVEPGGGEIVVRVVDSAAVGVLGVFVRHGASV